MKRYNEMSSGYTCLRTTFCVINVIFWIAGCGILGVGIWLRVAYEGYATLLPQYALISADSLAILAGIITLILSFFACCGSWFQNRCMLITYFVLVVLLFIGEFLTGSMAFLYRSTLSHTLREELKTGLIHHYNVTATGPNSLVNIWDNMQTQFRCCGVDNYEDWFDIDSWPGHRWVPDTCCFPAYADKDCGKSQSSANYYPDGCYRQINVWFMQRLYIIGFVCIGVAFLQLFGLVASMLLFCTISHKLYRSCSYKAYS
ncbi:tetraspanin-9 isoform X2 [Aethina tumida]|uniref:tetraspanin-9 isoform X2 n=1 Tax=Aethina tumida TaxID=116153 RepID=UPI00214994AC|nr:tetraspanin-9 isoform X2 [Aethina tumida]